MTVACRNCGHTLTGPFCSHCGQSEHDGHPPSLKNFGHDLVHEFLHFDGTIFRTIKALFLEPGRLTEEYLNGHVVRWVRPLRLFLIVVALHLLVSTGVGPLSFQVAAFRSAGGHIHLNFGTDPSNMPVASGSARISENEEGEILQEFRHTYSWLRYLSVLGFGLGLWAFYRRRRPNYVSHVIAGLGFYCFWYSVAMLMSIPGRFDPRLNALSMLSVVYLFLMLRRIYGERWPLLLAKTVLLTAWLLTLELLIGFAAGLLVAQDFNH